MDCNYYFFIYSFEISIKFVIDDDFQRLATHMLDVLLKLILFRRLVINRAPTILLGCCTTRINRKKYHKKKAEPPFLLRNCINGVG